MEEKEEGEREEVEGEREVFVSNQKPTYRQVALDLAIAFGAPHQREKMEKDMRGMDYN